MLLAFWETGEECSVRISPKMSAHTPALWVAALITQHDQSWTHQ